MELKAEHLTKVYFRGDPNEVAAVKDITIGITRDDFVVVTGPSGSGKTTLLSLLGLLTRPTRGRIFLEGEEVSAYSDAWQTRIRKDKFGVVFQQYNLFPQLPAWENVSLPLVCRDISKEERRKRAVEIMGKLGLGKRKDFKVAYLSGGEQQRIAIARALIVNPQVVLADEPTASVDAETAASILEVFRHLKKEKKTLIVSTHDPSIIREGTLFIELKNGILAKLNRA